MKSSVPIAACALALLLAGIGPRPSWAQDKQVSKPSTFEYQVWNVQGAHVAWINGAWQGKGDKPDLNRQAAALDSTPMVWDVLQKAGAAGWELVAVVDQSDPQTNTAHYVLFLKRSKAL